MLLALPRMFRVTIGHSYGKVHLKMSEKIIVDVLKAYIYFLLNYFKYQIRFRNKKNYGCMKMVVIRATPVVVKRIIHDNLRPQFSNNVTVIQKAGTSIARIERINIIEKIN